jgi:hypothetical protein
MPTAAGLHPPLPQVNTILINGDRGSLGGPQLAPSGPIEFEGAGIRKQVIYEWTLWGPCGPVFSVRVTCQFEVESKDLHYLRSLQTTTA